MKLNPKLLVGRKIIHVDMGTRVEVYGSSRERVTMHDPHFILDDGSRLYFVVEENPNGGEYGVDIVRTKPKRKEKPCAAKPA